MAKFFAENNRVYRKRLVHIKILFPWNGLYLVVNFISILGRITIGSDATVGGNIWVTENIPAGAKIVQTKAKK